MNGNILYTARQIKLIFRKQQLWNVQPQATFLHILAELFGLFKVLCWLYACCGSHFNIIVVLKVDCCSCFHMPFCFVCQQKYVVGQQKKREKTCSDSPEVKKRKMSSDEQSSDSCLTLDSNKQSDLKKPACFKVGASFPFVYIVCCINILYYLEFL